jgi:hypothetical protein
MNTKIIYIMALGAFMLVGLKPAGAETLTECMDKCYQSQQECGNKGTGGCARERIGCQNRCAQEAGVNL